MKLRLALSILIIMTTAMQCQDKTFTKDDLADQNQQASYAIGYDIGRNLKMQEFDVAVEEFKQGLTDALKGEGLYTDEELMQILQEFQQKLMSQREEKQKVEGEKNEKEGKAFFAENKTKEGVIELPSGMQYKVLKEGDGPSPSETDKVTVHYRGTFLNGEEFDSSYKRGNPATFQVLGVIKGWTEALQMMHVGDKWMLFIPYNLAYGEAGKPPKIPPYSSLIFEVELLGIEK